MQWMNFCSSWTKEYTVRTYDTPSEVGQVSDVGSTQTSVHLWQLTTVCDSKTNFMVKSTMKSPDAPCRTGRVSKSHPPAYPLALVEVFLLMLRTDEVFEWYSLEHGLGLLVGSSRSSPVFLADVCRTPFPSGFPSFWCPLGRAALLPQSWLASSVRSGGRGLLCSARHQVGCGGKSGA